MMNGPSQKGRTEITKKSKEFMTPAVADEKDGTIQRQTLIIESQAHQIKELTETMKSKELMTPAVADEKDRTIQRQTLIIESQAHQIKELTETMKSKELMTPAVADEKDNHPATDPDHRKPGPANKGAD
ncbi:unnamed protein product [Acanthoscelides obtectus]|uniref:Uncharacterized protein n=1 Tax=Acanthoscelides obtectus TaxID=200917 RepID=A0A9P0MB32_ACAOB|nr:unnamed protein product [Acanthoscelides obtectus]CAK1626274.1 hypothetical protein AOBTE_LOCUS3740 [Acanthoscelides obtectus]